MSLRFTIIINNYNYARYLAESVDSALAQTYPNTEVMVVDDGSTDDSRRILERYRGRATVIFKPNGGQSSACNLALEQTRGDLIHFLDSDDAVKPEMAAAVVAAYKPGLSKIQFPLEVIDDDGKPTGDRNPRARMAEGDVTKALLEWGNYIGPPTSGNVYPREVLDHLMPVPADRLDHVDFYFNTLIPFFGPIASVARPLGYYRRHAGSDSSVVAGAGVNLAQIRKLIRHDCLQKSFLEEFARKRGLSVSPDAVTGHWIHRKLQLAEARLAAEKRSAVWENAGRLIRSVWRSEDLSARRRAAFTAWALAVAMAPAPVAQRVVLSAFGR